MCFCLEQRHPCWVTLRHIISYALVYFHNRARPLKEGRARLIAIFLPSLFPTDVLLVSRPVYNPGSGRLLAAGLMAVLK